MLGGAWWAISDQRSAMSAGRRGKRKVWTPTCSTRRSQRAVELCGNLMYSRLSALSPGVLARLLVACRSISG